MILAGGRGSRLSPLTASRPKALLAVGDRSVLEILLLQLRHAGWPKVTLCVAHLAELIEAEFGDGSKLGLELDYAVDRGMGTAGPLRALPAYAGPTLVVNGDLLTGIDFGELGAAHLTGVPEMTIAAHVMEIPVGHDVLSAADGQLTGFWPDPRLRLDICAGIYVLSPEAIAEIPEGARFDMPDLIDKLRQRERRIEVFRFTEEWYDIGTPPGLDRARRAFADGRSRFLPADESLGRTG